MNFLLTGSEGFIGSYFIKLLKNKKIPFRKVNLKEINKKTKKNFTKKYTHLLHLSFRRKESKKNHIKNLGDLNFLIKNTHRETKIVFISTVGILNNKHKKYSYHYSKKACEKKIIKERQNFLIIRFPNAYGKNQKGNFLIPSLLNKLKDKSDIYLNNYNDKRDFIYVEDVVSIIYLLKNLKNKTVNINSKNKYTVLEVCRKIIDLLKLNNKILLKNRNSQLKRGFSLIKNMNLLKNYKFINLQKGLKKIVKI
jgi:nucleoside-diphosphate-sugar epimerase